MEGIVVLILVPTKLISFLAAMVTLPIAIYYAIRMAPGFAPRTWYARALAPLALFFEGEFRPEYRAVMRRARFWLLAAFVSAQVLWHTGEYLDSIRGTS